MDVSTSIEENILPSENVVICTGSKDKTVVVSTLHGMTKCEGDYAIWRSNFHNGKVGAVALRGGHSSVLLSASDDGKIALHDYKVKGWECTTTVVAELENAHIKPHSVEWNPQCEHEFMTGKV